MMKRAFLLALAAGLIASVAFTAPAQAGVVVDTKAFFSLTPAGATTTEIDFFYQTAGGLAPSGISGPVVHVNDGGLLGVTYTVIAPDEIKMTFTAANSTDGSIGPPPTPGIEFTFTNADADIFLKKMDLVLTPGTVAAQSVSVEVVPEPASLALLGIGMTGFLAFRRFLKKSTAA